MTTCANRTMNLFIAFVLLLTCSCTIKHEPVPVLHMTDSDLSRVLAENDCNFTNIVRVLHLDVSKGHIMEGSSIELLAYRFEVSGGTLFLEVEQPNMLVTRAFLVTNSPIPFVQHNQGTNTGEVRKP